MLIDYSRVASLLASYSIGPRGALHIGAHECEERGFYNKTLNIGDENIIWIDGNNQKVLSSVPSCEYSTNYSEGNR